MSPRQMALWVQEEGAPEGPMSYLEKLEWLWARRVRDRQLQAKVREQ